jgi:hypothetical protein
MEQLNLAANGFGNGNGIGNIFNKRFEIKSRPTDNEEIFSLLFHLIDNRLGISAILAHIKNFAWSAEIEPVVGDFFLNSGFILAEPMFAPW